MPQPTDKPAPATPAELDDLLAQAAAAVRVLPTIEECRRLDRALAAVIGDLADRVCRHQQAFAADTAEWTRCERVLIRGRDALCGSLGNGLRSAARHVAEMGQAARELSEAAEVIGR